MGTRTQRIDVHLKYIGNFDIPDTRTAEEIEAECIAEEKLEARRKKQREYARRKAAEKRILGFAVNNVKIKPIKKNKNSKMKFAWIFYFSTRILKYPGDFKKQTIY